MYEEGHKVKGAKKLPLTLEKALSHLDKSKVLKDAFGKETINSYIKLKNREIKKYPNCRPRQTYKSDHGSNETRFKDAL